MKRVVKTYDKFNFVGRKVSEMFMTARGYYVEQTEELSSYSGGKGILLFFIFPPLAFFGFKKRVRVTYAKYR